MHQNILEFQFAYKNNLDPTKYMYLAPTISAGQYLQMKEYKR